MAKALSNRSKVPHFESQRLEQQLALDNWMLVFAMTGQGVTSHQNVDQTRYGFIIMRGVWITSAALNGIFDVKISGPSIKEGHVEHYLQALS